MDFTQGGEDALRQLCRLGDFYRLIEEYVLFCYAPAESGGRQKGSKSAVFPNLAGFCRYIGLSPESLLSLLSEFPQERERLMTVLEDEALNCSASPTIVSAYLKKRLGYEKESAAVREGAGQIKIEFEHDIFEDGE